MPRLIPETTTFQPNATSPAITLEHGISPSHSHLNGYGKLSIIYTPSQLILTPQQLGEWIHEAEQKDWQTWEELAAALIDGFYDTLLPKEVTLKINIEQDGYTHLIELSQHHPK